MYTDRNALVEYNYHGTFFKKDSKIPESGNLLEDSRVGEIIIFETECDIQETNKQFSSGVITMGYTIYFPTPQDKNGQEYIPNGIKPGVRFRSEMYGMAIEGMVTGVYPSQMHGCVVYIKGSDI